MPDTPVQLRVPARCPFCAAEGTVALETSVSSYGVVLMWWCRQCEKTWAVRRRDELREAC